MKISTAFRIMADKFEQGSLKEFYWGVAKFINRMLCLIRKSNWPFAKVVAIDLGRFLFAASRSIDGQTKDRARAAVDWLIRAQDATADNGVSVGYFPCHQDAVSGWLPSYPETTGYIIHSLLEFASKYNDELTEKRALDMAKWEAHVQMPSGAVQGGPVCPADKQVAAIFNTGMVLQGYTAAIRAGADEHIIQAAHRAADFLVSDLGKDGHFQTHGDFVTQDRIKTYNCLCAWALYRFGEDVGSEIYKGAALRAVEAAVGEQRENGWFANNCLTRKDAPLTHTIGYTLQGILEVGILSGRKEFILAARRGVDPLVTKISESGFLHGRYYEDWEPASFAVCLTGNAQLAIVCYRLFEKTSERKYKNAGDCLVNALKPQQVLESSNHAINGAIAGSFPILGGYMTTGYPNWATKYYLDSLMLQDQFFNTQ